MAHSLSPLGRKTCPHCRFEEQDWRHCFASSPGRTREVLTTFFLFFSCAYIIIMTPKEHLLTKALKVSQSVAHIKLAIFILHLPQSGPNVPQTSHLMQFGRLPLLEKRSHWCCRPRVSELRVDWQFSSVSTGLIRSPLSGVFVCVLVSVGIQVKKYGCILHFPWTAHRVVMDCGILLAHRNARLHLLPHT